ncbi:MULTISPECIES: hypothetical protein [Lactobacillus]|uniref:Uncharacterized protein n=1 Tax=Lactobacillus xujianguonis TaxID=2495899 RepID=A0A437SVE6_9LACO|nr:MULTISPECIES: hypothetical protein [Lactobacillus]RVU70895.1 hypothetical protein EJK17_04890 [Lactobacillus xujianguonis]RVU73758.1 hypothetical protein EJK20_06535 [Lactobacillus xujianguonis]
MMKSSWKVIVYPLVCFFSLILSLVMLAKLAGNIDIFLVSGNLQDKFYFLSIVVYILLIVGGGYALTRSQSSLALIIGLLIFVFSIFYLLTTNSNFTLLIYYFLYALAVAGFSMNQIIEQS